MRWEDEQESTNVEDDRGGGGGGFGGGGGGFGGPIAIGGGGLGLVVVVILALVFGVDPSRLLGGGGGAPAPSASQSGFQPGADQATGAQPGPRADDQDASFSKRVLRMTEDTWGEIFQERGSRYPPPTLVLYDQEHPTGCGEGQSAMGPFYCPVDRKVYLDLGFFHELSGRFGAPGRFAEAYVIAHEVGHHVQNLLGISDKVDAQRRQAGRRESNQLSVRLELQADCYAGVWANRTNRDRHFLDPGDVDQGLAAAAAVGDDTLQKQASGRVVPDAFTHGTSAQRTHWFKTGFEAGDIGQCDTFGQDYGAL